MPSALLAQARILLAKRSYRDAHALCMEALKADPSLGEPLFLLGVLAADHDNHARAIELYDRAMAAGSDAAEALAGKARSLIALNRREEALAAADAAAGHETSSAETLDTIGVVYSRAGLHDRALPWYARAAAAAPRSAHIRYNQAVALQFAGSLDEARAAYEACLALDPAETRALTGLVQVSKQTDSDNHLNRLEAAWQGLAARPLDETLDQRLQVAHAIAKSLEDLGRPREAMTWLARGKAPKQAAVARTGVEDAALFEAAMQSAAISSPQGTETAAPVFVTGMPRTGTTLVDRILSSHPDMKSAGELSDFALCLKRQVATPSRYVLDPETLQAAAGANMDTLGRGYIRQVRATLGIEGRFVDKMPLNAFYAPLILRALPNATVVCLRRHPLDAVLSNYRQLFATSYSYYNYALGLETAARYYVGFDRMIAHFRETLPAGRFMEIHYEDIIAHQERETRRLLDTCGLSFDPACLSFHENKAPVATASSVQVRKPLYSSSIGRWKKVEAEMAPAIAVLQAAGLLDGY